MGCRISERAGSVALLAILAASSAAAQGSGDRVTGWHIVRRGENLILITRAYLGNKDLWEENWRLNPDLENPHFLRPGQRIRVLLAPEESVPTARLRALSGRVEERPNPLPWDEAREEDLLLERDGLRTLRRSSTELEFVDGTSVTLTEDSLIFLRRSGRRLRGVETRSVEIVEGQAEVAATAEVPPEVEVEILVGGATAVQQRDERGGAQTRARKSAAGGAEVMVYEGRGEVTAGGAVVEVPRGMGTAVPKDAPPSPPEKLLPPPAPLRPAAGSELNFPDPLFVWEPVEKAASYTLEVCSDESCARLVDRVTGLKENELRTDPLPVASLFWRVTAVSASGLDGYPSAGRAFSVLSASRDLQPPDSRMTVSGHSVRLGDRVLYDAGAEVRVEIEDAGSGVESWEVEIDGEAGEPHRAEAAARATEAVVGGPWATGPHRLALSATDRFGNRGDSEPLGFEVDADPPEFRWQVRWVLPLLQRVRPGIATPRWLRQKRRWAGWAHHEFRDAAGGPPWLVLAWGSEDQPISETLVEDAFRRDGSRTLREFEIAGNRPQIVLMASGVEPPAIRPPGPVTDGRLIWLTAEDAASGVVKGLRVKTADNELVFEAEDVLGNAARLAWPFR